MLAFVDPHACIQSFHTKRFRETLLSGTLLISCHFLQERAPISCAEESIFDLTARTPSRSRAHSTHSSSLYPFAPSSTVNLHVLNTIFSYNSRPAALAFRCHGPKPPLYASSLECQKPASARQSKPLKNAKTYNPCSNRTELISRQIPPLPIRLPKPILQ
jgi:hypothetical protein